MTKNKIIEIALELFSKHGYGNVSMDMIKDRADIAKGTLYYHFKSKDELFGTACDTLINRIRTSVMNRACGEIGTREYFLNTFEASIDYLWEHREMIRMFFIIKKHPPSEEMINKHGNLIKRTINMMKDGLITMGVSEKKASHISPLLMTMIISIFPGIKHGFYTDKDYYKKTVLRAAKELIGDSYE